MRVVLNSNSSTKPNGFKNTFTYLVISATDTHRSRGDKPWEAQTVSKTLGGAEGDQGSRDTQSIGSARGCRDTFHCSSGR